MAEVSLNIHGKNYGIACDDGQEDRVLEVGQLVDERARGIASAGAASNENHLLVLTALVLADEAKELQENVRQLQSYLEQNQGAETTGQEAQGGIDKEEENQIVDAIKNIASRLDGIANRLVEA